MNPKTLFYLFRPLHCSIYPKPLRALSNPGSGETAAHAAYEAVSLTQNIFGVDTVPPQKLRVFGL